MNRIVSVVVPTYNGVAYIEEALASVFAQTAPPAEVIVVDDRSTDGTADLVEGLARTAPVPLRLIRCERNSGGPARPINIGVAAAQGEFIAVLDQDDVFSPDKIDRQTRLLAGHPDASLAVGFCAARNLPQVIRPGQLDAFRALGGSESLEAVEFSGRQVLRALILQGNFLVGYPAFLFRKSHWQAKGGADEGLRVASDYDLLCWLCTRGTVVIDPAVHYVRREHDANCSSDRQGAFLDVTRVRERFLRREGWLLADETVSRAMREWFIGFAYWLREAGNYRGAWECYRLAGRVWGWHWPLYQAVYKLALHGLRGRMVRHRPVYNFYTQPGGALFENRARQQAV